MNIKEVPFGTVVEGKLQGVFIALTAWVCIYADYHGNLPEAARKAMYPMVLMMQRWDGAIGFPGGKVDAGEDLVGAAVREAFEEAGLVIFPSALTPLYAHEAGNIVVNLFRVDRSLAASTFESLRRTLRDAADARDAIAEGSPFWAHLADYGKDGGWKRLRNSNMLSTAVAEELDAVRAAMYADAPAEAWLETR